MSTAQHKRTAPTASAFVTQGARVLALLAALHALWSCGPRRAFAAENLLRNGDVSQGAGDSPFEWGSEAWKNGPEFSLYRWHHVHGAPGELEISNLEPNDARWVQRVHLGPGWYHFTAQLRAEQVSNAGGAGANLSIVEDGIISQQLYGTTGWQTVGFYLKVGESGAEVDLACRLGGFASLSTGKVSCRDFQATKVDEPAAGAQNYDLDLIRGGPPPPPGTGGVNSFAILLVAAMLVLLSFLGWRRFAKATGAQKQQPVHVAQAAAQPLLESDYFDAAKLAAALALLWVVILAIRRLNGTPYTVNFSAAFAGLKSVLPATGVAALKLWAFWALSAAVIAGLMLQIDPELELSDAILGGAAGVWVLAYLLGQTLGPIRLFRPLTVWILLAAGIIQIWRKRPHLRFAAPSAGQMLALLALGLLSIGMLPLQLGSPLAPYMDVLSYPAAVQRILSFGVYLPFDNDPYGCWGPRAQTPGLELFFAMLAMGSHVKLGVLAHSATMLPMAALIIFATYRLGLTLATDAVGGIAALLLFFGDIFRRMPGMRGTALDFALVALGLAFFLDRRRSRTLIALGALILGTAFAGHAIDGGLALVVAAAGTLLWLARRDLEWFAISALCLAGAALFALPELAIGLGKALPYPILPLLQFAGIALVLFAARKLRSPAPPTQDRLPWLAMGLVLILLGAVVYAHASMRDSMFETLLTQFPLLFLFAFGGLLIWAGLEDPASQSMGAALVAIALLLGAAYDFLNPLVSAMGGGEAFASGIGDISFKLEEYWCPYFLVFPASIPFALLYYARQRTRPLVIFALLTLLIYPWYQRTNVSYDYDEHSIAEDWAINLATAAGGFWTGTPDSRWTLGPPGFALVDFLRGEQANGRITPATHILHLAHDVIVMGDLNRFSVFTGINDDPIVYDIPATDIGWLAGGRVRPISELRQALAEHPAYILEQVAPPSWMKNPPDGYQEVFHQGDLRLFRRQNA